MSKPRRFLVLADVECAWEYEIYADSQEEALEMWRSGNHEFHVTNEMMGNVKATHIEDDEYNVTKLS
jgi:hypothetical protein